MPDRIDQLFAFIAEDEGGEGVAAFRTPEGWMPMVGADPARVESLKKRAREVAKLSGKRIRLCRFSVREELEVIEP